jgi:hypothetical protein
VYHECTAEFYGDYLSRRREFFRRLVDFHHSNGLTPRDELAQMEASLRHLEDLCK